MKERERMKVEELMIGFSSCERCDALVIAMNLYGALGVMTGCHRQE